MGKLRWWFKFEAGSIVSRKVILVNKNKLIWTYEWHSLVASSVKQSIIPKSKVLHAPLSKSKGITATHFNLQSSTLLILSTLFLLGPVIFLTKRWVFVNFWYLPVFSFEIHLKRTFRPLKLLYRNYKPQFGFRRWSEYHYQIYLIIV